MSKWIRGRLGRPIASIISVCFAISFLLPLAPPTAQAQTNTIDLADFFNKDIIKPTPVVMLDFNNQTNYKTGMLGRTVADALTIELLNERTFEVISRAKVEQVMKDQNLSLPLDVAAQALVATRLKCSYTISGDVEDVKILHSSEGTFAEVQVSAVVISKVVQQPINGARVVQRSSPKIGYSGNTDILVQEALTTAAFQLAQRLLDNRLPIATVLHSPRNGEMILKGGSTVGFRKGMVLVTVRRDSVTGRIRLTQVTPNECTGVVLEEGKGIAGGDKGVPIFEFNTATSYREDARERSGLQLVGLGMLGALFMLFGTENGNKAMREGVPAPAAVSMADAYTMGEVAGANMVTWPSVGSRVIAYVLYRDTNPSAPIAVLDKHTLRYIDSAKPLPNVGDRMEDTEVNITIDPETGNIEDFETTTQYVEDVDALKDPEMTLSETEFSITCHRIPLAEGETTGYQFRVVFVDFDTSQDNTGLGHPDQYRLFLGERGPISSRITLTAPPTLWSPQNEELPVDGLFKCTRVKGALEYDLQVSSDSTFAPAKTRNIAARIDSEQFVVAQYALNDIWNSFPSNIEQPIFWRMGARVPGQPLPTPLADANQAGWVYSTTSVFLLPVVPPSNLRGGGSRIPNSKGTPTGRYGHDRSLRR